MGREGWRGWWVEGWGRRLGNESGDWAVCTGERGREKEEIGVRDEH